MVVDGAQVEEVLLGEDGAVHDAEPGTLFVDMSTIAPADARRIGAALTERGMRFVDAPVTGSSPKAEDGTLTIMAGGSDEDFARARPLFDAMGEVILHVGPLGPRPDGEGHLQRRLGHELRDAGAGARGRRRRRASTSRRSSA